MIARAIEHHRHLQGSGLELQRPPVRIVTGAISIEELSRFWSGFFQTPYTLSTIYELSPVIVSSDLTPAPVLPVRRPSVAAGRLPPVLNPLPTVSYASSARVNVSGSGVVAGQYISIDSEWAVIDLDPDGRLGFALPPAVRAGSLLAELGALVAGNGNLPEPIAGTRTVEFTVRPSITASRFDAKARAVVITAMPDVLAGQTAMLSLYGVGRAPSVTLQTEVTAPSRTLTFPAGSLPAGEYLLSLAVDGVASELELRQGRYAEPAVRIR
jgi:hypothetical protein